MKIKQMALMGSALILSLGGMAVGACSSSNSPASGGNDSGAGNTSSSGGGSSSGAGTGSSSGTPSGSSSGGSSDGGGSSSGGGEDGGTSASCKIPTLHPNPAGDVYCGFGTDGGDLDCLTDAGTSQCCLGGTVEDGGYAPQVCGAYGSSCTNGTKAIPIECGQISDCTANGIVGAACCLQGTTSGPAPIASCPASDLKQGGGTGIVCEASDAGASDAGAPSCATGEIQVCAQDADCPSGKTCVPIHWKLYDIGYCN
jgi:hypothetical protein